VTDTGQSFKQVQRQQRRIFRFGAPQRREVPKALGDMAIMVKIISALRSAEGVGITVTPQFTAACDNAPVMATGAIFERTLYGSPSTSRNGFTYADRISSSWPMNLPSMIDATRSSAVLRSIAAPSAIT